MVCYCILDLEEAVASSNVFTPTNSSVQIGLATSMCFIYFVLYTVNISLFDVNASSSVASKYMCLF
jgi:hypothetical protein